MIMAQVTMALVSLWLSQRRPVHYGGGILVAWCFLMTGVKMSPCDPLRRAQGYYRDENVAQYKKFLRTFLTVVLEFPWYTEIFECMCAGHANPRQTVSIPVGQNAMRIDTACNRVAAVVLRNSSR